MIYIPGKTGNSDILLHYGVLGMKWSQRRNHARRATNGLRRDFKQKKTQYKVSKGRVSLSKTNYEHLDWMTLRQEKISSESCV